MPKSHCGVSSTRSLAIDSHGGASSKNSTSITLHRDLQDFAGSVAAGSSVGTVAVIGSSIGSSSTTDAAVIDSSSITGNAAAASSDAETTASSVDSWSSSTTDQAASNMTGYMDQTGSSATGGIGRQSSINSDATETTEGSSKSVPIVGVAVGVLVFVGLLVALWICIRRKKMSKPSDNTAQTYDSAVTPNHVRPDEQVQLPVPASGSSADRQIHKEAMPPIATPAPASGLWDDPAIVVFRIPHDKVLVETLVTQGGYGEVYRGTYKGERVAIKMLQPALRNDLKQINAFLAEAKIMASIEHERIVPFIGVAWDSLRDLCVVTKFMDGGDLRTLLKQFDEQRSRQQGLDADKIRIAMHVAHALAYLHSLKPVVIHRDLKSRNILLDSDWNAKLTDFGISREATDQTMTAGVGTMLWMAPEVMMGERYDEKADIFSFGLVLTELDSHQMPYASAKSSNSGRTLPDTAILQMVAMGRIQAQFSQRVPQWLREVGTSCLSLDPTDRPSAAELLFTLQTRNPY